MSDADDSPAVRVRISIFDLGLKMLAMRDEKHCSGGEIGRRLGFTKPYVNNVLRAMTNLAPEIREDLRKLYSPPGSTEAPLPLDGYVSLAAIADHELQRCAYAEAVRLAPASRAMPVARPPTPDPLGDPTSFWRALLELDGGPETVRALLYAAPRVAGPWTQVEERWVRSTISAGAAGRGWHGYVVGAEVRAAVEGDDWLWFVGWSRGHASELGKAMRAADDVLLANGAALVGGVPELPSVVPQPVAEHEPA